MKWKLFCLFSIGLSFAATAQIVSIPDTNFKNALINEGIDSNNDGEIQITEAEIVTGLFIIEQNIESLEGIQSFINLIEINFGGNLIDDIDLTQNFLLETIWLGGNNITQIDLTHNINLSFIWLAGNLLSEINLTQNINLIELHIGSNLLTELDISNNLNLEELRCSSNLLTNLVIINSNVKLIKVSNNPLVLLDVSECPSLEFFGFSFNFLTTIDLTQNFNLEVLGCGHTKITHLDLSQNTNLIELSFSNNLITEIDLTNNIFLEFVDVRGNFIENLDISLQTNLTYLVCQNNSLNSLNLKNGNNENMIFSGINNEFLNCIEVDDVEGSYNNQNWYKDEFTVYSEDCSLGVTNINYQPNITLYPNPVNTFLNLESQNSIKRIQVFNLLGEQLIVIDGNTDNLDFSNLLIGIYFIKIETGNGFVFKKIIKE